MKKASVQQDTALAMQEPTNAPVYQSGTSRPLTIRRARFVAEYMACGNGAEAARRAGYSVRRARVKASELLDDPGVQAEIQKLSQIRDDELDRHLVNLVRNTPGDVPYRDQIQANAVLNKIKGRFIDRSEHLSRKQIVKRIIIEHVAPAAPLPAAAPPQLTGGDQA